MSRIGRFFTRLTERLVRPIVRRKIRELLIGSIKGNIVFTLLVIAGSIVFAVLLRLTGAEMQRVYLFAITVVSVYRLCKGAYALSKYYTESSWLNRKLLKIGLRSALTDRLTLLLIAGYLLLSVAMRLVRKFGLEWIL